ncbi:hypothetical protein OIU79_024992 [Salix purpurea]|uniref:Uncharacterized protein n=1 Tax=Salix purpurea TaxID=77065 RepID=A0A9Q0W3V3_SALPP|nr:hypothetical protein OIU79_024992 [Salix purpurea]
MPRYSDITEMSRYTTWLMRVHGTLFFSFLALLCFWIISKLILKFYAIREQHA